MAARDPRRRYYVVTVMRHVNESAEDCDDRVARRLQLARNSSAVTCTVYEPLVDEFHKLKV